MSDELLNTLSTLVSEERNPASMDLDTLSALGVVTRMNEQDKLVPLAVEKELPYIAQAVEVISCAFKSGGRLIYVGAGTSGRLGVLDATECPPTFGVDEAQVVALIAGGKKAVFRSAEGAEDSQILGRQDLIGKTLTDQDVVVGIAASGRTPYVIGALKYASSIGASTVSLSCNANSELARYADIAITPVVGAEVLSGSTRLKSGTAQKLVLNMLTTASMVRSGKCYQNLMVDITASNKKLMARAIRIVMQATDCSSDDALNVLEHCHFDVKPAILMQLTNVSYVQAMDTLAQHSGYLHSAIDTPIEMANDTPQDTMDETSRDTK